MRISHFTPLLAVLPSALAVKPVKPVIANTTGLPLNIGLLTFPGYQVLDVFGPMDVLNMLSMLFKVPLKLSVLSTAVAPVSSSPKFMNASNNDFGEAMMPTITFTDFLAMSEVKAKRDGQMEHGTTKCKGEHAGMDMNVGNMDVLIIPGGGGSRANVSQEIAFVKAVYPKVKYVLTVCTGATIAARAGILDNRKATTNKMSWKWATSTGPNTTWVGKARWVDDGNIWSSSGVSAGSDMMYAWVGSVFGEDVANYLAAASEYTRWEDANLDPFSEIWEVPA